LNGIRDLKRSNLVKCPQNESATSNDDKRSTPIYKNRKKGRTFTA
jgi:hypothetical protein